MFTCVNFYYSTLKKANALYCGCGACFVSLGYEVSFFIDSTIMNIDKKRDRLIEQILEWNASRFDLFHLSIPDEVCVFLHILLEL